MLLTKQGGMSNEKYAFYNPVSVKNVQIHDSFFSNLMKITVEKLIPYQWRTLNDEIPDAEPSYCMRNFKIAAGIGNRRARRHGVSGQRSCKVD